MILYVNGDSHTAAAEAVNPHAFAEDDSQFFYMGRAPHPGNLAVSWGRLLADTVKATFKCDAEAAASNHRILRTSREWLTGLNRDHSEILMIIQWSTWERQEWLIDGVYYQITASGEDTVPESHRDRYRKYILDVDWHACRQQAHEDIWQFHQELQHQGIRHVFFNGNNHFGDIESDLQQDWAESYVAPYDGQMTYDQWLKSHGHHTVAPNSWHFGRGAHAAWSRFMLQYIVQNKLV
jgi:hypothetical protein